MSRVGKRPVDIPDGVSVEIDGCSVKARGKLGERTIVLPDCLKISEKDGKLLVERLNDAKRSRGMHGLGRTLVANLLLGVTEGFFKELVIEGVGFRAQVQGKKVVLSLGFASPKEYLAPETVTVTEQGGTRVKVEGMDKQQVGLVASRIRSFYPSEPYKGKGIRYVDEIVRRKVGKTVA